MYVVSSTGGLPQTTDGRPLWCASNSLHPRMVDSWTLKQESQSYWLHALVAGQNATQSQGTKHHMPTHALKNQFYFR